MRFNEKNVQRNRDYQSPKKKTETKKASVLSEKTQTNSDFYLVGLMSIITVRL